MNKKQTAVERILDYCERENWSIPKKKYNREEIEKKISEAFERMKQHTYEPYDKFVRRRKKVISDLAQELSQSNSNTPVSKSGWTDDDMKQAMGFAYGISKNGLLHPNVIEKMCYDYMLSMRKSLK